MKPEMKPLFEERMRKLIPDKVDFQDYEKIIHEPARRFVRCNTLKISHEKLAERLRKKWQVTQPFHDHPEIFLIQSELKPGELGNSVEHLLGYYYIQEISSMMPAFALAPSPGDFVLDLCASPGSKTTQIASLMKNQGTIIANDLKLDRIKILSANLERCGVSNVVITRNDAVGLCARLVNSNFKFDKILLDAPCSGEGTLRSSAKTFQIWNLKVIQKLSREQKKILANAIKCLKVGGTFVYSTCTHAPEENEEVVNFALKNFPVKIESIHLPLKCRPGLVNWEGESFNKEIEKSCRIYPQDNDSEGFFIVKMKLMEEIK